MRPLTADELRRLLDSGASEAEAVRDKERVALEEWEQHRELTTQEEFAGELVALTELGRTERQESQDEALTRQTDLDEAQRAVTAKHREAAWWQTGKTWDVFAPYQTKTQEAFRAEAVDIVETTATMPYNADAASRDLVSRLQDWVKGRLQETVAMLEEIDLAPGALWEKIEGFFIARFWQILDKVADAFAESPEEWRERMEQTAARGIE